MSGVLVPLVPRTTFVFDDLQGGSSVATALIRGMPLYAWLSADLVLRVDANSLAAGLHSLDAQIGRTAPTPEDPGDDFVGSTVTLISVTAGTGQQVVLVAAMKEPWTPFADLIVQQSNVGGLAAIGSVTLSIDVIVRGRPFDRADFGPGPGHRSRSESRP